MKWCLLIMLLLCSCNPQWRLAALSARHPRAAVAVCTQLFPVKENTRVEVRTVTDTAYLPGSVVSVNCDSLLWYKEDPRVIRVPCPPQAVITKVITKDSTVVVENTAALKAAQAETGVLKVEAAAMKTKRDMWRMAALIFMLYAAIRIALRLWLKINLP